MKGYVVQERTVVRRHLRGARPDHRAGTTNLASSRHRPRGRRTSRRPTRPRTRRTQRPGAVNDFGVYLTTRWLPGKRLVLADSTYDGYRRNIERHVLPALGSTALRRLRPEHLENVYERLLRPARAPQVWPPRRCTKSTSLSAAPSPTQLGVGPAQRRPRRPRTPAAFDPQGRQQAWSADELQVFLRALLGTGCSPPCGSPRSPACAATNSSASAGTTSTRPPRRCPSTAA